MKKLTSLLVLVAVMFAFNATYAQNALTIHVTGGYSVPLPDLKGTWPDDFTANKSPQPLYMKNGWNAGADIKYYVDKKLRSFGITLSLAYMGFSSGDLAAISGDTTGFGRGFKTSLNSFTAALGVEYRFLTKKKAHPFVGVEFAGNFLSGKATPTGGTEYTLKSTSRWGLTFGAGVDINLGKNLGIVLGGKYALMNLIGQKAPGDETASANEYLLIDKKYTPVGGTEVKALSMQYIQLYGGVTFYLMQPKKMVKK